MKKMIISWCLVSLCLIADSAFAEWLPGVRTTSEIKDLQIAREADADIIEVVSTQFRKGGDDDIEDENTGISSGFFNVLTPDASLCTGRRDEMPAVRSNLD